MQKYVVWELAFVAVQETSQHTETQNPLKKGFPTAYIYMLVACSACKASETHYCKMILR